jgi:thiamine pyrophosphate-dependent acetolactate synthase large subunit-like protein
VADEITAHRRRTDGLKENKPMLTTSEYFDTLVRHSEDALVICGLGVSTNEWWGRTHRRDSFFVNGAMGYAGSIGIGLAAAVPDRKVLVLDSDGGLTMNASGLITEAARRPANMIHVVLNNGVYGVLKSAPIVNGKVTNYAAMARGAGINGALGIDDPEEFDHAVAEGMALDKYTFIEGRVEEPDEPDVAFEPPLPMPYEGPEMKYVFGRKVEEITGRQVFGPQGF